MATYPPTSEEIKQAITKYPHMANRPSLNPDLDRALLQARGDIALECPQAEEGSLNPALVNSAWAICLELAVWYIRKDTERNMETGTLPGSLIDLRDQIDARLEKLGVAASKQDGLFLMEPFCALPPVPFPSQL